MEIKSGLPIVAEIATHLKPDRFTLVDIGCSGGINAAWREFGECLRAFGFDPNLEEINRLAEAESLSGVEYVPAFVGLPADDPGAARLAARTFTARNPWARLSVARTLEIRTAKAMSNKEKTELNEWSEVPLANADKPILVQDLLRGRGIDDVDFIKIDVDGPDFLILRSLKSTLAGTRVLGVCVEVNFFGSDDPDDHSFHNVDRFLKSVGFELFDLSKRHYSTTALPAPYLHSVPSVSEWGRILQGDAIYFRDLAAPHNAEFAASLPSKKIAKLAALFAMFGLPDCAAELFLRFKPQLAAVFDVEKCIAALVRQAAGRGAPTYFDYIGEFEADGRRFYPNLRTRARRFFGDF